MKEHTKRVILLVTICIFTLAVLVVALKLHDNRENNLLAKSDISNYLTEINYDEIENHVVEQPSSIIYVSNSSEETTQKFDEIFIPVIKKYNLENEIIYININNTTLVDPFYQNAPELIFYSNAEIEDVIDVSTLNKSNEVEQILKERGIIGD